MSATTRLPVIDLNEELATLAPGSPSRIVGLANESCLKLSLYEGEGSWHSHPTTAELFLVLEGELVLDILDGARITLGPRQLVTIPAGVVHRPRAEKTSVILVFKPRAASTERHEPEGA
jgi:mannose-6-phosphate isomerase-like protein (cupin superfamily)